MYDVEGFQTLFVFVSESTEKEEEIDSKYVGSCDEMPLTGAFNDGRSIFWNIKHGLYVPVNMFDPPVMWNVIPEMTKKKIRRALH